MSAERTALRWGIVVVFILGLIGWIRTPKCTEKGSSAPIAHLEGKKEAVLQEVTAISRNHTAAIQEIRATADSAIPQFIDRWFHDTVWSMRDVAIALVDRDSCCNTLGVFRKVASIDSAIITGLKSELSLEARARENAEKKNAKLEGRSKRWRKGFKWAVLAAAAEGVYIYMKR